MNLVSPRGVDGTRAPASRDKLTLVFSSPKKQRSRPAREVIHVAARLEDRLHEWRRRWARSRKLAVTVVPYRGYGSPTQVRILARVLLTRIPKPGSRLAKKYAKRADGVRGWRSFVSVPVSNAVVTITINGESHTVTADRGGVVDTLLEMSLSAGIHKVRIQSEDSEVAEAEVNIAPADATLGLISDVDDTVMVTALPRPFLAFWNAFVLNEHARVQMLRQ